MKTGVKTGMESPLIVLIIVFVAVSLFISYQSAQANLAIERVKAEAIGKDLPAGWLTIGEMGVSWIVKAAIGAVLVGFGGALAIKAWGAYQQYKKQARYYPTRNATTRQPAGPRSPSETELYRMMLYQQMTQQNGGRPPKPPQIGRYDDNNDPEISF